MFSPEQINSMLKQLIDRNGGSDTRNACSKKNNGAGNNKSNGCSEITINPSQILVIAGLLSGALSVESILVDKDQTVEIVVSGSLKRKTELDKMLDEIGSMSFDQVMKAMLERLM